MLYKFNRYYEGSVGAVSMLPHIICIMIRCSQKNSWSGIVIIGGKKDVAR